MSAAFFTHAAFLAFGLLFLACAVSALSARDDCLAALRVHYGVILAGAACAALSLMSEGSHAGVYVTLAIVTAAPGVAAAFLRRTERDASVSPSMKRP